jgi:hypothetical protein
MEEGEIPEEDLLEPNHLPKTIQIPDLELVEISDLDLSLQDALQNCLICEFPTINVILP